MGAIAVLTGGSLGARMQAETACRMAVIEAEDFRRLAFAQPAIHRRVMRQVAPVMSKVTEMEQSRERLSSLGTMAAGLAHELNNPAAAARRAAAQLTEALEVISSALAHFVEAGVEREQAEQLVALQQEAFARAASATALDALDAADAEDEVLARLEALGVEEPWRLAEPLAVAGVDQAWLDRVAGARGRGDRSGAALGGRDADGGAAGGRARGVHRAHVDARRGGQVLRLHGPRRARRGGPARGSRDDADGARLQAQAHRDRASCATTTARFRSSR